MLDSHTVAVPNTCAWEQLEKSQIKKKNKEEI